MNATLRSATSELSTPNGRPRPPVRILVTDGEQRSSLAVVRSLGREGYSVCVTSISGRSIAGASRFCQDDHKVPDPTVSVTEYLGTLEQVIREGDFDMLIPMTDVAASVSLSLRGRIPRLTIPFPDATTWTKAVDKAALVELGRELGVPVPDQFLVPRFDSDRSGAFVWAAATGYPVVVKPHRSAVLCGDRVSRLGVQLAADERELTESLAELPASAFPVLVQERVVGPGLGGFFLADRGRIVASFAHRRLREKPPTGGVSVLRESIELRADIGAYSESLLRSLGWSGVAMVEFKEDSATGRPVLMEINGRFWGSLQLAADAEVDFPRLLVELFGGAQASDRAYSAAESYQIGRRSRWFWGDVDHLIWLLRTRTSLGSGLPGKWGAIRAFFQGGGGGDSRLEVLRLADPAPFLRETRLWFQSIGQ